jgi:hypothetical protein
MRQETGETRDAIIEDVNKRLADIVAANKNRKDPYWVVLFAKPFKNNVEGKPNVYTVAGISGNTFQLQGVNTTGFTAYTSGGMVNFGDFLNYTYA